MISISYEILASASRGGEANNVFGYTTTTTFLKPLPATTYQNKKKGQKKRIIFFDANMDAFFNPVILRGA